MAIRLTILLALLLASLLAYLAALNPLHVTLVPSPWGGLSVPMWGVLLLMLLIGGVAALVITLVSDTSRPLDSAQRRGASEPSDTQRPPEHGAVAARHYEHARREMEEGRPRDAVRECRDAVRADSAFSPAYLLMGDAYRQLGEPKEAMRAWERGCAMAPALPIFGRLEQLYREEGRPSRMIELYREAVERHPDARALAFQLGRVYFELAMLDEALEQFQQLESELPEAAAFQAHLGAIHERRGQLRQACEAYRKALQLATAFEWRFTCVSCGVAQHGWAERCRCCGAWNSLRL